MASSLSRSFPLFILSLVLLCCLTFADLIDDVCHNTLNPSHCSKSLRSDPRSCGADLKLLGQISIDLTSKSAKSGVTLVHNLKNAAKHPKLKEIYDTCLEMYDRSVDELAKSSMDLKNGDFPSMNIHASAAETDILTCDDSFTDLHVAEPAKLKAARQNLHDLCGIIYVISNLLRG